MFIDDLFRRRVLWVTGKGGVGKSTMAAALALLGAGTGRRTLLIDVEGRGDAASFLDAASPRYEAKQAHSNLWHLAMQPERILDEYLRVAMRVPRFYRVGPVSRVFDFIATAAPGVREVLIAGKVGFEDRATDGGRPRWDLIVVDAAPSGQVLSHLRSPRSIQELVDVGLIRSQTEWVRDLLEDPERTGLVVVSVPEEMPTAETEELVAAAPDQVATPILALIANRVVTASAELAAVAASPGPGDGLTAADLEAVRLFATLGENQAPYLDRLGALGLPLAVAPLVGAEHHDLDMTRTIAEAL